MVTLNGEPFPIYSLDTIETIRQRAAAQFDSLPTYIIFDPELSLSPEEEYQAVDILEQIKIDSAQSLDIGEFYRAHSQYFADPLDLVKTWLAYNSVLTDNPLYQLSALETIKSLGLDFNADQFMERREEYRKGLERRIVKNKDRSASFQKTARAFQKIEGIEATDFKLDTVSFSLLLDLTGLSLLEIFNALVLTPPVPLASVGVFFKIYRDFKPPVAWSVSLPDAIVLKATNSSGIELAPLKSYNDVFITLEEEADGESRALVTLDFSTARGISRARMIDRVLGTIAGYSPTVISEREEKLKGVYYYPAQSINKYIFADLVMNDPLFSGFLGIDESVKATKAKPSIYFYFADPRKPSSSVTAVVTEKLVAPGDADLKREGSDFRDNEPYLRVRISSAKNRVSVENFISTFSKLMEVYNQEYEPMLEFYRRFVPDFGKKEIGRAVGRGRLKDVAPEVFLPLYSKKCNRKPMIVDEETALQKPEGERMLFPATPEEGRQHYYVCPSGKHKYPGLFINNLANSGRFPYLPCCYAKDRSLSKGSNYRKYFYGEEETGEKKQQTVLTTNKTATSEGFGYLPPGLSRLFEMIDLDSIYYRKGVARGKSSFLECVLEALYEETGFLIPEEKPFDDGLRLERVKKQRAEIADWPYLAVGRQELYDVTVEDISRDLANQDLYLSPKKYIRILEAYFKCNIFLFSRDDLTGRMELPRFSQAYLRYALKRRPSVLVYEHWGGKAENLGYPQCEIIVRWDERDEVIYSLGYEEPVVQELGQILERMRRVYNFGLVPEIILPGLQKIKIKSQAIDSYGKTRSLDVDFEGTVYSIITEPIAPLIVSESSSRQFARWKKGPALKFLEGAGVTALRQNVSRGILYEIHGRFGTVGIILPIQGSGPVPSLATVSEPLFLPADKSSNLATYNYLKRSARYLTQYCFYIFSIYIYEGGVRDITSEVLEQFVEKKIDIIPDYQYREISRTFSLSSGFFQGDKLVVPSDEVLKRLIYVLRLKLEQQFSEVVDYRLKTGIPNFYLEITDFDIHPDQIILQGESSVEKWILDPEVLNVLRHGVLAGGQPYFFQNREVGEGIYLAQNGTGTFKSGVSMGKTWAVRGFNPGRPEKEDKENLAFRLYSYQNEEEIKPYSVIGKNNSYDIRVLGYKRDGVAGYTVLMPVGAK